MQNCGRHVRRAVYSAGSRLTFSCPPGVSLRRYYVDRFYVAHVPSLPPRARVLDLGGTKIQKRGRFDVEAYGFTVVYGNVADEKRPDVVLTAEHLPFAPA